MTHLPQPPVTLHRLYRCPRLVYLRPPLASLLWILSIGLFPTPVAAYSAASPPAASAALQVTQTVIDGLPPPPSIPELAPPTANPSSSSAAESTNSTEDHSTDASGLGTTSINATPRYRVLVNSDSPFLLEQVRRVEPAAVFERYQGQSVILAGQFSQLEPAQQRLDALADQGIGAEIAVAPEDVDAEADPAAPSAPTTTTSDADEFDQLGSSIGSSRRALPPANLGASAAPQPTIIDPALERQASPVPSPQAVAQQPAGEIAGSDYYIVVPGDDDALDRLQGQIALLGANPGAIAQRDEPLGPHLLIGPFISRQSATRWNQYLRDFGMDARVYYRR